MTHRTGEERPGAVPANLCGEEAALLGEAFETEVPSIPPGLTAWWRRRGSSRGGWCPPIAAPSCSAASWPPWPTGRYSATSSPLPWTWEPPSGPGISAIAALVAEFMLTAVLLIAVLSTAVDQRAPGGAMPAGLAIGLWIGTAVFAAFPISGGSLNPVRTLGPDIVSAAFASWWIYVIGPLAGSAVGGGVWQYLKKVRQPAPAGSAPQRTGQDAADGTASPQRAGKCVVEQDRGGKYHFTLVAGNGQVIAASTGYERRQAALNGIESVKKNAPNAEAASPDGE
jgi:uncharacterized protein YegP (UPF0339 family)